jgi:hypothetical protein
VAAGAPANTTGNNGDMYINSSTGDVYGPKASGVWGGIVTNIKGATGPAGYSPQYIVAAGPPPAGTGNVGDMYINSSTSDLYGPKTGAGWGGIVANIKGSTGAQGPPGVAYTPKGTWSSATTYAQGDEVTYSGILYISLQSSNLNNTPSTSPTYWQQVASSGTPGGPAGSVQFNNTGAFGGSSNLMWDNTNIRLGVGNDATVLPDANTGNVQMIIGATAPGEFTVRGNITATNSPVGSVQFANYNISAAEKRIAVIYVQTDSVVNSGNMLFYTANAGALGERMRITSAGNVGIGNPSPQCNLSVYSTTTPGNPATSGTTDAGVQVRFYAANVGTTLDIGTNGSGVCWLQNRALSSFASPYPLALNPNGGNVGIGTTNPTSREHIISVPVDPSLTAGSAALVNLNSGGVEWTFGILTSGSFAGWMQARSSGGGWPLVLNPLGGNVGIGNTLTALPDANSGNVHVVIGPTGAGTPVGEFTVCGNTASTTTAVGTIQFANYNISAADKRIAIIIGATDAATNSGNLLFYTYNAGSIGERMRITSAGNVGIGWNNPTDTLMVRPASGRAGITIQNQSNGSTNETTLTALHATAGYGWRQRVQDLDGSFILDVESASTWLSNAISVKASNGYVGILKTGASYPLDVAGDVNCTGSFRVNGSAISAGGGITTQSVVTGSRTFNTAYQNTTGKPMSVVVSMVATTSTTCYGSAYSDSASTPTTLVAAGGNNSATPATAWTLNLCFWVLPGNYYRIVTSGSPGLACWTEWY